jgi:phosphotriesterase-related protein
MPVSGHARHGGRSEDGFGPGLRPKVEEVHGMRRSRSIAVATTVSVLATASAVGVGAQDEEGPVFHTTAGPLSRDEIGDVLAHHHIFVELGAVPPVAYLEADPEIVYQVIGPWLEDAKELGIGTFIEFTPLGVGRRPDIVQSVADRVGLPTMLATGIYREPYMPDWVYDATVDEIADFLRTELTDGVEETGVPAGFIKLSQNDTGITLTERKILEASCIAAQETGAAIASHITSGPVALAVIDALETFGCPLDQQRFIWVHSQLTAAAEGAGLEGGERVGVDPGFDYLLEALERGAYVSLDAIGSGYWTDAYGGYDLNIGWIQTLADAGYEDKIIIGADTGWFDPGHPPGFEIEQVDGVWTSVGDLAQDYRSVPEEFVPAMREAGFDEELITKLMQGNPWGAFSR